MKEKPKKKVYETRKSKVRKTGSKAGRPRLRTDRLNQGPNGRPLNYNEEFHCVLVYNMAALEAHPQEIADEMKINLSTFYEWKKKYPKFSENYEKGKKHYFNIATKSLGMRAKGIKVVEEQEMVDSHGRVSKKKITKELPPDVSACEIILRRYDAKVEKTGMDGAISAFLSGLHDKKVSPKSESKD